MRSSVVKLLMVPVLLLAGITALSWLLAVRAPTLETNVAVEIEPPYFRVVQRCVGDPDDPIAAGLRNFFPPGGVVRSAQLYNCPRAFDNFNVTYTGEVIGELIRRRGGVWAQVNDDAYALRDGPLLGHRRMTGFNQGIAVWFPDGTHEQLELIGRHRVRGDVVEIVGRFLRADPRDGGGMTIRAEAVRVVAPGVELDDPLYVGQLVVAVLLGVGAVGALLAASAARRNR